MLNNGVDTKQTVEHTKLSCTSSNKRFIKCIVNDCSSSTSFSCDKVLFTLPKQDEDWKRWLIACNRDDLLGQWQESHAVCADHFLDSQFKDPERKNLISEAVPTMFQSSDNRLLGDLNGDNNIYIQGSDCESNEESKSQYHSSYDTSSVLKSCKLCRLCASEVTSFVYIFSDSEENSFAQKINSNLPIKVMQTDPLPKQLCEECAMKVNLFHEFVESCIQAEAKLISLMHMKFFRSDGDLEILDRSCLAENDNESPSEKQEVNSEEGGEEEDDVINFNILEETCCLSCPLCLEGNIKLKRNEQPVTVKKELSNQKEEEEGKEDCDDAAHTDSEITLTKREETEDDNEVSQSNDCATDDWWNLQNAMESVNLIVDTLNPDNSEKDEHVCCVCNSIFSSMEECLQHSKEHIDDQNFVCSVCSSFFTTESEFITHCQQHRLDYVKSVTKGKRLTCTGCNRRFNNDKTFSAHACGFLCPTEVKQFRCEECQKIYSSAERLAFHKQFHAPGVKANECCKCGKMFDNEGSLYYHVRMVHERERPFSCDKCDKRFFSNSRLESHKRVHTGERPFECEVCGRRFYDRETLKGHYVTHMAVKPFQCEICGTCCGRLSILKMHMKSRHGEKDTKRAHSLIQYNCVLCNQVYTSATDVLGHRATHWGDNWTCEFCGHQFNNIGELGSHRKQEHASEKPYVCSICSEKSQTLYEARQHRKVHTDKQKGSTETSSVVCETCGMTFENHRSFTRHIKQEHTTPKSFPCDQCRKVFPDKQRLLVHTRFHTGERPYCCAQCGKRFTQSSALYTHSLLHTGEKPHRCDICNKQFRIKADRDNHRRTHTGEKPFRCDWCGQCFRTGQVYYQHRMIHTGERRFPCHICGKAFKRSHTLVVHKRIHTGEKPNICDVCGKGFRQKSDMRKHRALHDNH